MTLRWQSRFEMLNLPMFAKKTRLFGRLFVALVFLFALLPINRGVAAPYPQEDAETRRARDLLARMTPDERVGQLFIVTFTGTEISPESEIYDLIFNHYVGSVILLDKNSNFPASDDPLESIRSLTNRLQATRFAVSQDPRINSSTGETFRPAFVPLFIGISQDGDGYPTDQINGAIPSLPSQLAIGATWNPDFAHQVGSVAGERLSSLGFNLLLGPSLDVNETPKTTGIGDLGVRTFGGDPFWVGEMGRAYIAGVHQGSEGRMAVVSKHFPGLGSADRLPEDEVATVRKSLDQLKQIELAPFFAVTGDAETPAETTDALLTSHIRYQGLQGNIRATTRPVSLDQTALNLLLDLPALTTWRADGGVMISDDIGSKAIRDIYDPTGEGFVARRAALDAFLAGNDLIYMGSFLSSEENSILEDQNITSGHYAIIDTLDFFTQKYREDPGFTEQVDAAVLRVLLLKYKLYGFFTLTMVLPSVESAEAPPENPIAFSVAQQAATLINPPFDELENILPAPPTRSERIVIFTDSYESYRCPECQPRTNIAPDALEQAILRLYGAAAGDVVSSGNIASHTFWELEQMLNGQAASSAVDTDLRRAHWIIFLPLELSPERPESYALTRFLSERPDLAREKNIIAFALNAPYYLDATDISKLTAFYGLYSKPSDFIDVAARLLFRELQPVGASPVSIPGIGYDLISVTSPGPEREFWLTIGLPGFDLVDETTPSNPRFHIGESIPLITSVILDHNGHPVPNNTPVEFRIVVNGEEINAATEATVRGTASTNITIDRAGIHEIWAIAGDAKSVPLTIDVPEEKPTVTPSPTTIPTEATTTTQPPTTQAPSPPTPAAPPESIEAAKLMLWFLGIIVSAAIGWLAFYSGARMGKVRRGVRWGLSALIGGLLLYSYAMLQLPGIQWAAKTPYQVGLILVTAMGSFIGWGLGAFIGRLGK